MNNTVINIKTSSETKEGARQVAEELGFSLSSLINAYLKELVRTQRVSFTLQDEVAPYFMETLQESQDDVKKGKVSPSFSDPNKALDWLKSAR